MLKRLPLLLVVLLIALPGAVYLKNFIDNNPRPQVKAVQGIPILMYHKVDENPQSGGLGLRVPEKSFEWQMKYLHNHGYHTVTLQDIINHWDKGTNLPPRPVVITFDDGYENNYTKAYPIMRKYGFTATVFIATDYIGRTNAFDLKYQPVNKMLNWDQIKKLHRAGFDIEAHTMSHPRLKKISREKIIREITLSKKLLEDKLNKKVLFMAYPYGDNNRLVREEVKKAGYLAAVVTDPQGLVDEKSDRYALRRVRILGHYDNQTFVNVINNPEEGFQKYLYINKITNLK